MLRDKGYRLTPQRELVLQAVDELGHATPDEVHAKVRESSSAVNISTIYRTLELLEELGLVRHTHLTDRAPTYHSKATPDHVHLVCRGCGAVLEAQPDEFDDVVADLRRAARVHPRPGAPDRLRHLPRLQRHRRLNGRSRRLAGPIRSAIGTLVLKPRRTVPCHLDGVRLRCACRRHGQRPLVLGGEPCEQHRTSRPGRSAPSASSASSALTVPAHANEDARLRRRGRGRCCRGGEDRVPRPPEGVHQLHQDRDAGAGQGPQGQREGRGQGCAPRRPGSSGAPRRGTPRCAPRPRRPAQGARAAAKEAREVARANRKELDSSSRPSARSSRPSGTRRRTPGRS